jgi:guanylate kinase
VKPPSIDELKIRLKKRSTESEDKINMRIAKVCRTATAHNLMYYQNYDLDTALEEAHHW